MSIHPAHVGLRSFWRRHRLPIIVFSLYGGFMLGLALLTRLSQPAATLPTTLLLAAAVGPVVYALLLTTAAWRARIAAAREAQSIGARVHRHWAPFEAILAASALQCAQIPHLVAQAHAAVGHGERALPAMVPLVLIGLTSVLLLTFAWTVASRPARVAIEGDEIVLDSFNLFAKPRAWPIADLVSCIERTDRQGRTRLVMRMRQRGTAEVFAHRFDPPEGYTSFRDEVLAARGGSGDLRAAPAPG